MSKGCDRLVSEPGLQHLDIWVKYGQNTIFEKYYTNYVLNRIFSKKFRLIR